MNQNSGWLVSAGVVNTHTYHRTAMPSWGARTRRRRCDRRGRGRAGRAPWRCGASPRGARRRGSRRSARRASRRRRRGRRRSWGTAPPPAASGEPRGVVDVVLVGVGAEAAAAVDVVLGDGRRLEPGACSPRRRGAPTRGRRGGARGPR